MWLLVTTPSGGVRVLVEDLLAIAISHDGVPAECEDASGADGHVSCKLGPIHCARTSDQVSRTTSGWVESKSVAGASAAVVLRHNGARGRHLVARKPVKAGELLLVEPAFTCVMTPDASGHCDFCLRLVHSGILCPGCGSLCYCSEECHLSAWQQYHAAECHIPSADLQNLGLYARLALRTVLTAGPRGIQGAFSAALDSSRIYLGSEEQSNSCKLGAGAREAIIQLDHKDGEKKTEDELKEEFNSVPESRENMTSFLGMSGHEGRGYNTYESENEEELTSIERSIPGCWGDGMYCADYRALFHLEAHLSKRKPHELFYWASTAAALCHLLHIHSLSQPRDLWPCERGDREEEASEREDSGRGVQTKDNLSKTVQLAGILFMKHILQLQCNGVAIMELVENSASNVQTDQHIVEDEVKLGTNMTESNVVVYSEHRIALAIFPSLCLLNHACRPNVVLHFCGRTAYLRAVQPIAAGQELLLCYGPQEGRMPRAERIRKLRAQYYFRCSCQACQEKPKDPSNLRCEHCGHCLPGVPLELCHHCDQTIKASSQHKAYEELRLSLDHANHLLEANKEPEVAIGILLDVLPAASHLMSEEHEMIGELYDLLARGHAMQGQWKEAAKWVQKSLVGVKKRFGEKSPEAAQEMFKLAQLLFNGRCVAEAVPVVDEAFVLLNNSFGRDHFLVAELQQMQACLQQVQDSVRLLSVETAPC
uniref:SET and MYND domain-containing protein 4-like isoform X2 n=1 Tax=Myxine glutinosa TaxID=7769 RepID=UPI00358E16B8